MDTGNKKLKASFFKAITPIMPPLLNFAYWQIQAGYWKSCKFFQLANKHRFLQIIRYTGVLQSSVLTSLCTSWHRAPQSSTFQVRPVHLKIPCGLIGARAATFHMSPSLKTYCLKWLAAYLLLRGFFLFFKHEVVCAWWFVTEVLNLAGHYCQGLKSLCVTLISLLYLSILLEEWGNLLFIVQLVLYSSIASMGRTLHWGAGNAYISVFLSHGFLLLCSSAPVFLHTYLQSYPSTSVAISGAPPLLSSCADSFFYITGEVFFCYAGLYDSVGAT